MKSCWLTALALLSLNLSSTASAEQALVGISPHEADLAAMRLTLRQLEALINDREPERLEALLSPRISDPQRQAIQQSVEALIESLPAEATYQLRTDIGRGALVPVGPDLIQIQVRGTAVVGESREGGPITAQLEATEHDGGRRWLFVDLLFPGQQRLIVGGWSPRHFALAALLAIVVILLIAAWFRHRRQNQ